MRAARFHGVGKPLAVEEIDRPRPGPGEALVEVKACGVCGSDLHIALEGITPVPYTPITLGHEPAGLVAELGTDTQGPAPGSPVAICPFIVCRRCLTCRQGDEQVCLHRRCIGIQAEGALAEFVKVPVENLVPLPPGMPLEQGAIITDAVATPFHALTATGRLAAGESVAVFGCGGLGVHAVQLARLAGAGRVAAVDVRPAPLERARALGADLVVNAAEADPVEAVREMTGGLGVDLAVELVGANASIAQAVEAVRTGGRAVVAGLGAEPITVQPPVQFVRREVSLLGSYAFTVGEIATLAGLAASGRLDLSASVSLTLPLEEVNQALERLHRKEGDPVRIVVRPDR
jgi:D-arabinose 1-dehydrogenase-like Zn-dependent alcohol dehydrogenase